MNKNISYMIDDKGLVYSRVGSMVAVPVLEYDKIGEGGDYTQPFTYQLEKVNVLTLALACPSARGSKKIPRRLKNLHRVFWGMPELTGPLNSWEAAAE